MNVILHKVDIKTGAVSQDEINGFEFLELEVFAQDGSSVRIAVAGNWIEVRGKRYLTIRPHATNVVLVAGRE